MKNLKNIFIAMVSILLVACASFMFFPVMGMIVTFNMSTYFTLISGGPAVINALISMFCVIGYIAIEFGE